MSALKFSFLRINSNGDIPQEFCNIDNYDDGELYGNLRPLFSHYEKGKGEIGGTEPIYIGTSKYTLWCNNGKRYKVELFYDEDGQNKSLLPNHRMNAMADAGRFTSKKFDYIPKNNKNHNQNIKTNWGSNYFVGDIICKFSTGKPFPDCSIFGENPINFIMSKKTPNTRMINAYGTFEEAENAINECIMMGDEFVDYHIIPKVCEDDEYKELLKSWGIYVSTAE